MKTCKKCLEIKELSDFPKDKRLKDGRCGTCQNCITKRHSDWVNNHRDSIREYNKARSKQDRINNPEMTRRSGRKYWLKNKKKIHDRIAVYRRERMARDINYRILNHLRCRIYHALKGRTKSEKTTSLLGCSVDEFKQHITRQLKEGMTWNNYGQWHIDHIRPCKSFDLSDIEQQRQCFNYNNLQPLWASENFKKSFKWQ